MYQGRFEHSCDDKGRLAIPSPFRKRLDEQEESTLVITVSDQCLAAYPLSEWQKKMDKIASLNQLDPKVVAFKRVFVGCAQECPIDKAGRILVPSDLRQHAGIERDCVVLGQLDKFEIWSSERWSESFAAMSDQIGSISASLAEVGVQL